MTLTPRERILRARLGGFSKAARYDGRVATQPAREAFAARFERQVDPDGELDPAERGRRAEAARKAYFAALALKSAGARARKQRRRGG